VTCAASHGLHDTATPQVPRVRTCQQVLRVNTLSQAPKNAYSPWADRQSWWALRSFLLTVFELGNATNPYTSAGAVTYDYQSDFDGNAPITS